MNVFKQKICIQKNWYSRKNDQSKNHLEVREGNSNNCTHYACVNVMKNHFIYMFVPCFFSPIHFTHY